MIKIHLRKIALLHLHTASLPSTSYSPHPKSESPPPHPAIPTGKRFGSCSFSIPDRKSITFVIPKSNNFCWSRSLRLRIIPPNETTTPSAHASPLPLHSHPHQRKLCTPSNFNTRSFFSFILFTPSKYRN